MGFFIAPSAFVSSPIACDTRLCRLATRDIASAKTVINSFMPRSPIPFSEGNGEAENPDSATKKERTQSPEWVIEFFWLSEWNVKRRFLSCENNTISQKTFMYLINFQSTYIF